MVDLQHGLLDYSDMVPMLQALSGTNTVPFVRVPWRDTWQIDRALDAGAMGVIVPLVNNRAHAEEVVQAMKYPNNPKTPGVRSCGPVRSMGLYGSEHMERVRSFGLIVHLPWPHSGTEIAIGSVLPCSFAGRVSARLTTKLRSSAR